jgi:hypothetical protein
MNLLDFLEGRMIIEQPEPEEYLVPCDMHRVCDSYESLKCESKDFRQQCRKLDDF